MTERQKQLLDVPRLDLIRMLEEEEDRSRRYRMWLESLQRRSPGETTEYYHLRPERSLKATGGGR